MNVEQHQPRRKTGSKERPPSGTSTNTRPRKVATPVPSHLYVERASSTMAGKHRDTLNEADDPVAAQTSSPVHRTVRAVAAARMAGRRTVWCHRYAAPSFAGRSPCLPRDNDLFVERKRERVREREREGERERERGREREREVFAPMSEVFAPMSDLFSWSSGGRCYLC